jgi:hypothetical protein
MKRIILLFVFFSIQFYMLLFAQQSTLSGKITDFDNDYPINGAAITIKNSTNGTVSDIKGKFNLITSLPVTLVIVKEGFTSREIEVESNSPLDILMEKSKDNSIKNVSIAAPSSEIVTTVTEKKSVETETDFSQSTYTLPENKFNDTYNFDKLKDFLHTKAGYNFAWNNNSFTNPIFATNIENGTLQNTFGMDIFWRHFFWTSMFADYDFSFSSYNMNITQYAVKASLSTILFPTTRFFLPSVGVGYQLSSLQMPAPEGSTGSAYLASSNTSSLFWKVGVQSFISRKFSIHFEYAQTLFNEKKSASMISLGLGIYIK